MKILVDTSVWSLAFRRRQAHTGPEVVELKRLVEDARAVMLGVVRQELLSGVRVPQQFVILRDRLRAFRDLAVDTTDFELAAEFFNTCQSHGVQGSNTDYLICAIACRYDLPIFTTDEDFKLFSAHVPVRLHRL